jgi:hypothetical protein
MTLIRHPAAILAADCDQMPETGLLVADTVAEVIGNRGKCHRLAMAATWGTGLRRLCGERRGEALTEMPDATHAAYLAVSGGGRAIILPRRRRF